MLYLSMIESDSDRSFFERIYYSYRKQMYAVAFSVLQNEYDAEDAVHDVFCRLAEKYIPMLRSIRNEQDMKNYLLKAAKNSSLNKLRTAKRHISLDDSESEFIIENEVSDNGFLDMICDNLSYQELLTAIKSLDRKYEEVLYLHFVIRMSVPQVADFLNRNTQTVKKQLVRGKSLLLEKISPDGGDLK